MYITEIFVCISVFSVILGMESSKSLEGYPTGFLADCKYLLILKIIIKF